MHCRTRRKLGIALMASVMLVVAVLWLNHVVLVHVQVVVFDQGSSGGGPNSPQLTEDEISYQVNWRYAGLVLLAFVSGLACVLWPARKPPSV